MMKKIWPFVVVGICMALFNMTVATMDGGMSESRSWLMFAGNVVFAVCNVIAAIKTVKELEQNK